MDEPPLKRPEWADRLIDDHYDDLYRFLRGLTRHVQEAEDLAQRTLVRAYRNAEVFEGRSSLRTWLHGIAYREYLNWRRGRRLLSVLDPLRGGPDKRFESFIDRERLVAALAGLSPKLSAAFVLVEVQEMTNEEAAEALAVPVGTIKSRLHKARIRLRQLLQDPLPEANHVAETL